MGNEILRWADAQQYRSEPMPAGAGAEGVTVTLLNATPDPLGSIAALCGIYEGRVIRSLAEVTDEMRRKAFEDMTKTVLNGSLEAVQFHFLIEGVSRDFTHQAVRSRASFFAQESLRFAVKENFSEEVALPPYLAGLKADDPRVVRWKRALWEAQEAYETLVNDGVPAEEARKLLPHAVTTRYHWIVDLRTLLQEAGKRTCTQAQFDWRIVFAGIAKALREHSSDNHGVDPGTDHRDAWQFAFIADKLRPNCFQTGSCGFMAQFDRGCSIRERVEANAAIKRPSSEWGKEDRPLVLPGNIFERAPIPPIEDWEWATDPGAARIHPTNVPQQSSGIPALRCPTCGSRDPLQHPAVSGGGEVAALCQDPFHGGK